VARLCAALALHEARLIEALVSVDFAHEARQAGLRIGAKDVRAEDFWDISIVVKEGFFEDQFASHVDYVAVFVAEVTFLVDQAALSVNCLANIVLKENWLTTRVHFNFSEDTVNVEPGEGEDLR
jgi:hypothetical protein